MTFGPARTERDWAEIYGDLTAAFGEPVYKRIDAPATTEQKAVLENSRRTRSK
jgi:phosphoglucomutase